MSISVQKRDDLAVERTRLANQRTALAFARTFIGFLGGGVSAITIPAYVEYVWLGYLFIVASFVTLLFGVLNFIKSKGTISKIDDYHYFANGNNKGLLLHSL